MRLPINSATDYIGQLGCLHYRGKFSQGSGLPHRAIASKSITVEFNIKLMNCRCEPVDSVENTLIPQVYVYVTPAPPRHLYGEHPQNEVRGAF